MSMLEILVYATFAILVIAALGYEFYDYKTGTHPIQNNK